ncbi:F actin capping protein subunit alpha [Trichuris trichiura]|uniref:F-actin-capping protein subunit alpha n=1 Tax=Trichuris trichiura TaxID=36087 RepID=A0A077YWX6_TRITR|nr:F actin capping protein subunit alpha [Trichuris trichiura]
MPSEANEATLTPRRCSSFPADVRSLLKNDESLKKVAADAFAYHNKKHFFPVAIEGVEKPAHVTPYNEIEASRFYHPRNRMSFRFDHMQFESTDWSPYSDANIDQLEPKRSALEAVIDAYIEAHFKQGSANVYGLRSTDGKEEFVVCIVNNRYQPKNFWNGHWKSRWTVRIESSHQAKIVGKIKVIVHYFEDGNVQLVNSKPIERSLSFTNDVNLWQTVVKIIGEEESNCQKAIGDSCHRLGDSIFRGLRRQLPVTRSKIDWPKLINYKVGTELKPQ